MTKGIRELETFSLGWRLNKPDKRTYFDLTVTALKGTDAAQELAQLSELKTAFRGFTAPGAVVTPAVPPTSEPNQPKTAPKPADAIQPAPAVPQKASEPNQPKAVSQPVPAAEPSQPAKPADVNAPKVK
jgi:hypothetical protein